MPRRPVRPARTWRLTALVVAAWPIAAAAAPQPPRAVAVIDATGDPDGAATAARVGAAIEAEPGLAPLEDAPAARALIAPLLDEDAAVIADARAALEQANDALVRFDESSALGAAATGQTRLREASPRPLVTALLADLIFTEGLARLGADHDGALVAFAEVHRLDPARKLDPAHFPPDVTAAYESAGRAVPGSGSVSIEVDGPATEIWIDGVHAGSPPTTIGVTEGIHFVTVTGPDAITTGARVRVDAGKTAPLHLTAARADETTRLARMRRRLLESPDDAVRAASIAAIARTVGTDAAVVIVRKGDALGTRVWRDQAPGLGPVVAFTTGTTHEVLAPLVPPREPSSEPLPRPTHPALPPEPPWWKKTWVRNVAAIGAIVVVGSVITFAVTRDPGSSTLDTTIGVTPP